MKRLLLLAAILSTTVSFSTDEKAINPNSYFFNYSYDNAVYFVENGIEFNVFINGDFDFSTRRSYIDYNGNRFRTNRNSRIVRDFDGRIRRIGTVSIRYDRFGNVRRIGNVTMNYFRGRLTRVGSLTIRYDRWGYPIFYGNVNGFRSNRFPAVYGNVYYYNDPFFTNRNFGRNYIKFREDRDFYYYKARPNSRVEKGREIIKRRKETNTRRDHRFEKENGYRKSEIRKRDTSENGNRKRRS